MILVSLLVALNALAWWFFADVVSSTTHRLMGWFAFIMAVAVTLWMIEETINLGLSTFKKGSGSSDG